MSGVRPRVTEALVNNPIVWQHILNQREVLNARFNQIEKLERQVRSLALELQRANARAAEARSR